MLSQEEVDEIAKKCMFTYNSLPKCGKPVENEWTVLSCVVLRDTDIGKIEVVSLGTGSKCIGASKMSPYGDIMNDSHAEVFARRSFLLYLYDHINKAFDNNKSIFTIENKKYRLKENIEFIFYSSQLPCGDASIVPINGVEEHFGQVIQSKKRPAESNDNCCNSKKPKTFSDIHRTGAKCLVDSEQDPKKEGTEYHTTGVVRTKPGRGDRTLSMSCSDKIARWVHCGIQGSLLDLILVEPIFIRHFIFGSGVPFSKDTIERALFNRNIDSIKPKIIPEIYQTKEIFPYVRNEKNIRPAPGSICWNLLRPLEIEVAVQGRKLGLTKKAQLSPSKSLSISKYNVYKTFLETLKRNTELKQNIVGENSMDTVPYNVMKKKSAKFYENWSKVKESFFVTWTVKPDMWNFCVNVTAT